MARVGLVLGLAVMTGPEMVMVLAVDCRAFPVVQWPRLLLPMQGAQVQSLVRELDSHTPQLKVAYAAMRAPHATRRKTLYAATKTLHSQVNKIKKY